MPAGSNLLDVALGFILGMTVRRPRRARLPELRRQEKSRENDDPQAHTNSPSRSAVSVPPQEHYHRTGRVWQWLPSSRLAFRAFLSMMEFFPAAGDSCRNVA